jgi:hypothetical protein
MTLHRFFHWGRAIVLAFVLFAGFIGTLVYRMASTRVELVRADYYQSGEEFDEQFQKQRNTARLATPPAMTYLPDQEQLSFLLPTRVARGEVAFVRPSDQTLDFKVALTDQPRSLYRISTRHLRKGFWKVQLTWSDGRSEYYAEDDLTLE